MSKNAQEVSANKIVWDKREAVELKSSGYSAVIVPSLGSNVISLKYTGAEGICDILRTPEHSYKLLHSPYFYGIPVLFPANRVQGGTYTYDGIVYDYPRNFPNNTHINGILHNHAWQLVDAKTEGNEAITVTEISTVSEPDLTACIPIDITFRLKTRLSSKGMKQTFTVVNNSDHTFPFGLAYHTSFNVPVREGSAAEATLIHVPVESQCASDENTLPNGESVPLQEFEQKIASPKGYPALATQVDALYNAKTDDKQAVIRDASTGCEVVYETGPDFRYWIITNFANAEKPFVCINPQSWLSNAINTKGITFKETGVILVKPHSIWEGDTRLFIR